MNNNFFNVSRFFSSERHKLATVQRRDRAPFSAWTAHENPGRHSLSYSNLLTIQIFSSTLQKSSQIPWLSVKLLYNYFFLLLYYCILLIFKNDFHFRMERGKIT